MAITWGQITDVLRENCLNPFPYLTAHEVSQINKISYNNGHFLKLIVIKTLLVLSEFIRKRCISMMQVKLFSLNINAGIQVKWILQITAPSREAEKQKYIVIVFFRVHKLSRGREMGPFIRKVDPACDQIAFGCSY